MKKLLESFCDEDRLILIIGAGLGLLLFLMIISTTAIRIAEIIHK